MTLESFIGHIPLVDQDLDDSERICSRMVREGCRKWVTRSMRPLAGSPGYHLADGRPSSEDIALIWHDPATDDHHLVGGFVGEFLWIMKEHRGRGLSAELVIAKAAKCGAPLEVGQFTPAGRAAFVAAHRLALGRAARAGYRLPKAVEDIRGSPGS